MKRKSSTCTAATAHGKSAQALKSYLTRAILPTHTVWRHKSGNCFFYGVMSDVQKNNPNNRSPISLPKSAQTWASLLGLCRWIPADSYT